MHQFIKQCVMLVLSVATFVLFFLPTIIHFCFINLYDFKCLGGRTGVGSTQNRPTFMVASFFAMLRPRMIATPAALVNTVVTIQRATVVQLM